MTFISVVIPIHGDEQYLARCVASLRSQRYTADRFEIIIVDNGASPATRGFVDARPELIVIDEPGRGAYAARNAGIRIARGDVIAFTDADCAVSPDWLATIARVMEDPATNVVVGSYSPARPTFTASALADYENAKNRYIFNGSDDDLYYGFTNNMAVRAVMFDEIGGFVPRLRGSDAIFARTIVERYGRETVRFEPDMSVHHLEIEDAGDYYRKVFVHSRSIRSLDTVVSHRPLRLKERIRIFKAAVRNNEYSTVAASGMLALLVTGMVAWEAGALVPWKDVENGKPAHIRLDRPDATEGSFGAAPERANARVTSSK